MNFTQLLELLLKYIRVWDAFLYVVHKLRSSNDPMMIISQCLLGGFCLWIVFRFRTPRKRDLRPGDFEDRLTQFRAGRNPLAPKARQVAQDAYTIVRHGGLNDTDPHMNMTTVVITSPDEGERAVTDFSTTDFMRQSRSKGSRIAAEGTIAAFGVGSCGPRGFYGTITPHMDLENHIGEVMRSMINELITKTGKKMALTTDESHAAIAYSFGYATISSVISAFVKHQDYVVYDEAAPSSIQTGVNLSKSAHACAFSSTAVEGGRKPTLDAAIDRLEREAAVQKDDNSHLRRKFIVVEGISAQRGTLVDLPAVLAVARKHHWRVLIDDSFAIGVLGAKGRGTIEHYADQGLLSDPAVVEFIRDYVMVTFTFSNALGSIGGACFGTKESAEFQTLNGLGYIFSASAPPYLCTVASHSLRTITDESEADLATLRENAVYLQDKLVDAGLAVVSDPICPMKVIEMPFPGSVLPRGVREADGDDLARFDDVQTRYSRVCKTMRTTGGYLVDRTVFSELDPLPLPARSGVKVNVSSKHSKSEIDGLVRSLKMALDAEF
ncbi:Aminotransferase class I and II [Carpediemonas membranifera]|uniref:serine C-palmitoyltransferase n=1 Tax=Carpediemonas membranifera TaxID=201153 RepID=A0A8J6B9V9_9EUKA|nr:Aminotransferase class I and II [Carpediemonas membranifera]|eukprot:KAG9395777.1 Aminotransferase class I and II [Carpediemonas membranifera]